MVRARFDFGPMPIADDIARLELAELEERGLLRALEPLRSRAGAEIELRPGERLINLSSNDSLGLAGDPRIAAALAEGAALWGTGSGASRLVTGDFLPHRTLEGELARFEGSPAATLFNSGYAANCSLIPVFAGPSDVILSDELNHASLIDGCRLSRARVEIVRHADPQAFKDALTRTHARRVLVVTDTIFSMDGDRAPLAALSALCRQRGAMLFVDEAHATGVVGPQGTGLAAEVSAATDARMATLSKAVGVLGAHVAASREVCDLLVNRARPLVFSTALPPAIACAASAALRILAGPEGDDRRRALWRNIARFADGLRALGLRGVPSSHIFPVLLGSPERAVQVAAALRDKGVLVKAIRPPTVPPGTSRLRFSLSAAHTEAHVDTALAALRAAL